MNKYYIWLYTKGMSEESENIKRYNTKYIMNEVITYRVLTIREQLILEAETKKSPYIGFIRHNVWDSFGKVFVLENKKQLIGVCVPVRLRHWCKLGPILVLSKFQGKGFGKILLSHAFNHFSNENLYIGAPNDRIVSIVTKLGFTKVRGLNLPIEIKTYLFSYLFQRFSLEYITDAIRKKFTTHRWKYSYFIHPNTK